jgi:hypothetical protein
VVLDGVTEGVRKEVGENLTPDILIEALLDHAAWDAARPEPGNLDVASIGKIGLFEFGLYLVSVNFNGQFLVGWRNIRNSNFEFQRVFTFLGYKSGPLRGGVLLAEIRAACRESVPMIPKVLRLAGRFGPG